MRVGFKDCFQESFSSFFSLVSKKEGANISYKSHLFSEQPSADTFSKKFQSFPGLFFDQPPLAFKGESFLKLQVELIESPQSTKQSHYSSLIYRLKHPDKESVTIEEFEIFLDAIENGDFQKVATEEEIEAVIYLIIDFARKGVEDPLDRKTLEEDIKDLLSEEDKNLTQKDFSSSHFLKIAELLNSKKDGKCKRGFKKIGSFIKKHKKTIIIGTCVVVGVVGSTLAVVAIVKATGAAKAAEAVLAAGAAAAGTIGSTQNSDTEINKAELSNRLAPSKDVSSDVEPIQNIEDSTGLLSNPFKEMVPDRITLSTASQPDVNTSINLDFPDLQLDVDIFPEQKEATFSDVYRAFAKEANLSPHLSLSEQGPLLSNSYDKTPNALDHDFFARLVAKQNIFTGPSNDSGIIGNVSVTHTDITSPQKTNPSDLELTYDFIKGMWKGGKEGAKNALVNLGSLGTEFLKHPIETADKICDALRELSMLALTDQWGELCEILSPEVCHLAQEWNSLSSEERGELYGCAIGTLGTDFIVPAEALKLAAKGVKGANKLLEISKTITKIENATALQPAFAVEGGAMIGDALPVNRNIAPSELGKEALKLKKALKLENPSHIIQLETHISEWLGEGSRLITNDAGDLIFLSEDGSRCARFDFNITDPHNNVHGHIEAKINGKWVKSGPIYPVDVPHN